MSFLTRLISVALILSPLSALAELRTALVIGNSNYEYASPLANPVNDAKAMSVKLQQLGFNVVEGFDLTHAETKAVVREFSKSARESDINLLFYAGHGMAAGGTNYIVPVDARLEDETALDFEAVEVDFITRMMSYSDSANLVFLDACRDNPLSRSLSRSMGGSSRSVAIAPGLAEMRTPSTGKGLAIAFATSPGEVALDGEGVNSPFTTALLRHLDTPNADISAVLSQVVGDVWKTTGESQRPWLSSSLTGSVILNPKTVLEASAPDTNATATTSNALLEQQKMLFDMARESDMAEDYQAYLDTFPNGLFANNARRAVQRLRTDDNTGQAPVKIASAAPKAASANARSSAIVEMGTLALSVTPAVRSLPASQATEALLGFDRQKRGEIQSRLNTAGTNVGFVDGKWGPKTRRGISAWQSMNGLVPSGYFNSAQLELLVAQTEGRFTPYTAPVARKSSSGRSSGSSRRNSSRNNGPSAGDVGAVLQGMGALIGALKK